MPGFGATIRAGAAAIALTAIAQFLGRLVEEVLPFLRAGGGESAPTSVTRTIEYVELATGNLLLVLLLSVVVFFLTRSYLNSEVSV
jgi:mannose/fructose/N-acetylgalactosamine-specific phosphotransferase system component IIC